MSKESKNQRFECLKKGHVPMDLPIEVMVLEGHPFTGRVCRRCKVAYFEQISDKKIEPSGLVDSKGAIIV